MPQPRYRQQPLHRGYRYQDLIASLAMAEVLARGEGSVGVEEKRFEGDRFDDVVLAFPGVPDARLQVKHRTGAGPLRRTLFANDAEKLGLDRLMEGEVDRERADLRVLSTLPSDQDTALEFIAADVPPALPGLDSNRWRLDPLRVWPDGQEPVLGCPTGSTATSLRSSAIDS